MKYIRLALLATALFCCNSVPAAHAQKAVPSVTPVCDQLCADIKSILAKRGSGGGFSSLKDKQGDTSETSPVWTAKSALHGAGQCAIVTEIGLEYECFFESSAVTVTAALAAIRRAIPAEWIETDINKDGSFTSFGASPSSWIIMVDASNTKVFKLTIADREYPQETDNCHSLCIILHVVLDERASNFSAIEQGKPGHMRDSTIKLPGSFDFCMVKKDDDGTTNYGCFYKAGTAPRLADLVKQALSGWTFGEDNREGGFTILQAKPEGGKQWVVTVVTPSEREPTLLTVSAGR